MEPVMVHKRITYTFEEVLQTESDIKWCSNRVGDPDAHAESIIDTLVNRFKRNLNAPSSAICEYNVEQYNGVATVVIDIYWLERSSSC